MNFLTRSFIASLFLCLNASLLPAQFAAGLGAVYGSDIDQFAPNLRVYLFPNDKICFGPEIAWFPSKTHDGIDRQLTEYNFSAHYVFELTHHLAAYPLLGVNYSVEKESGHGETHTESALGANLGGGVHLVFGRFLPFAEYKYVASELSQHVISIGALFTLSGSHKKSSQPKENNPHHE